MGNFWAGRVERKQGFPEKIIIRPVTFPCEPEVNSGSITPLAMPAQKNNKKHRLASSRENDSGLIRCCSRQNGPGTLEKEDPGWAKNDFIPMFQNKLAHNMLNIQEEIQKPCQPSRSIPPFEPASCLMRVFLRLTRLGKQDKKRRSHRYSARNHLHQQVCGLTVDYAKNAIGEISVEGLNGLLVYFSGRFSPKHR